MTITILPWQHASELAFVRDCFYPQHSPSSTIDIYAAPPPPSSAPSTSKAATTYRAGLRRVEIWTFRSPRSVPRAVAATAGLIDAKVHDSGVGTESTLPLGLSETALKAIYAMAFLRFVNGFVDRDVSRAVRRTGLSTAAEEDAEESGGDGGMGVGVGSGKSVGESSMYAHAATIGMPSSFVDLRHRCVHGEVPGLGVLRGMNEKALQWLWERWWSGNATGDAGRYLWEKEVERERMEKAREEETRVVDGKVEVGVGREELMDE